MNEFLVTLIENSGYFKNGRVNHSKIDNSSTSELLEFCEEISQITAYKNLKPETSTYTHSASLSLGGSRTPCHHIDCRMDKVKEMTQFAAFYSDKVYINNFFYNHVFHADEISEDEEKFKKHFKDDITVFSYLYPFFYLIE